MKLNPRELQNLAEDSQRDSRVCEMMEFPAVQQRRCGDAQPLPRQAEAGAEGTFRYFPQQTPMKRRMPGNRDDAVARHGACLPFAERAHGKD